MIHGTMIHQFSVTLVETCLFSVYLSFYLFFLVSFHSLGGKFFTKIFNFWVPDAKSYTVLGTRGETYKVLNKQMADF